MDKLTIDFKDIKSLAKAIKMGITTPDLIADNISGFSIIEDCLVNDDAPVIVECDSSTFEYDCNEYDTNQDAIDEFIADNDFEEGDETYWVKAEAYREGIDEDGRVTKVEFIEHKFPVHPKEPRCVDAKDHEWESPHDLLGGLEDNPGVFGKGGGVIIERVCVRCGCSKVEDTWAQDRETGEQGLYSISYREGKFAKQIEKKFLDLAIENLDAFKFDYMYAFSFDDEWYLAIDSDLVEYGLALHNGENPDVPGKLAEQYKDNLDLEKLYANEC